MKKLITILITALLIAAFGCQKKAIPVKDRYTQINIGAPDAGAGDNLYTAFTKVNANFAAVDDSLELKAPIANPNFTGVARLNTTDTLATQAYARAKGGGSSEGEGVWGGITGTLSDQTDLQSALNAKAPTVSPTFTTSATLPAATSIGNVSSTEISYLDGARENIQDQLDDTTSVDNLFSGILNVLEYGAISNDGNSDTAAINTAIRAARNAGGTWGDEAIVWIPPGIYNIDGGLTMYSRVTLMMAKNAVMYVSSGYEGACIIFPDDAHEEDFLVQGGFFIEQNPKQYKWTGVQMYKTDGVTTSYSTFGEMRDITFFGCGIGIDIYLENNSWVNGCVFERINFRDFKIGVKQVEGGSTNTQFRANKFISCGFQGGDSTLIGVQLSENQNMFIGCSFWDWSGSDQDDPAFVIDTGSGNEFIGTYRSYALGIFTSQHDNDAKDMKVAKATITYSQDGVADTIAYLPNLAIVWDIDVRVTTNFNDSGTDLLDIGTSASGATFLNDHDVSSGQGSFASITPSTPLMIWGNNYITATYNGQNDDSSAGEVRIWIHYTLK